MSENLLTELAGAVLTDGLTFANNAVASTAGAGLAAVLKAVMTRREKVARETLLAELANTGRLPVDAEIDDCVAILYRYARAAQEGTARLNLRLLAAVFAGQVREREIVADDFLHYADMLASLRRRDVVVLGTLLRITEDPGDERLENAQKIHIAAIGELVPSVFDTAADYNATAAALQRTGLVVGVAMGGGFGPGGAAILYRPTALLFELHRLVDIEGVTARDAAGTTPKETSGHDREDGVSNAEQS